MKLVKRSRNNFIFKCPKSLSFKTPEVTAENGKILFSAKSFNNQSDCEAWIKSGTPDGIVINKSISDSIIEKSEITDKDWGLMVKLMPNGDSLDASQFVSFDDYLAFNIVDRSGERFPKNVLNRLAKTLPGKLKIDSHNWDAPSGIGKYYKTRLKKVSVDEMMKMSNDPRSNYKTLLKEIEAKDKGLYWLVASFYVPIYNERAISDIGAGLTKSSIGLIGGSYITVTDNNGNFKYYEYTLTDRTEAVEGSKVVVESQYGAEIKGQSPTALKSIHRDSGDESRIISDENEKLSFKKGENMNFIVKSLSIDVELEEVAEIKHITASIEEKVEKLLADKKGVENEVVDLKSQLEKTVDPLKELADIKVALGDTDVDTLKAAAEQLKKAKAEAETLKTALCNEIVKMQILNNEIKNEPERVEKRVVALAKWDIDELEDTKKSLLKAVGKPQKSQISNSDNKSPELIRTKDYELN